jgi:hypothetical protein
VRFFEPNVASKSHKLIAKLEYPGVSSYCTKPSKTIIRKSEPDYVRFEWNEES